MKKRLRGAFLIAIVATPLIFSNTQATAVPTFSITYDPNGGYFNNDPSDTTLQIASGLSVATNAYTIRPQNPQKPHYLFLGWSSDSGATFINSTTVVSTTTTYRAIYSSVPYKFSMLPLQRDTISPLKASATIVWDDGVENTIETVTGGVQFDLFQNGVAIATECTASDAVMVLGVSECSFQVTPADSYTIVATYIGQGIAVDSQEFTLPVFPKVTYGTLNKGTLAEFGIQFCYEVSRTSCDTNQNGNVRVGVIQGSSSWQTTLPGNSAQSGTYTARFTPNSEGNLTLGVQVEPGWLSAPLLSSSTLNVGAAIQSASGTQVVNSVTVVTKTIKAPKISWAPKTLSAGDSIGGNQLNAAANVPGKFTYSVSSGEVVKSGPLEIVATFTPEDQNTYSEVITSLTLMISGNSKPSVKPVPVASETSTATVQKPVEPTDTPKPSPSPKPTRVPVTLDQVKGTFVSLPSINGSAIEVKLKSFPIRTSSPNRLRVVVTNLLTKVTTNEFLADRRVGTKVLVEGLSPGTSYQIALVYASTKNELKTLQTQIVKTPRLK